MTDTTTTLVSPMAQGDSPVTILTIATPSLGDRSYIIHDGRNAAVIDPQRDIDRVLNAIVQAGVVVRHVLETHVHNDYVTGGYALAQATHATYWVAVEDDVRCPHSALVDGTTISLSPTVAIMAMSTPGHTHHHLSFALRVAGEEKAVFTGGSLLYGSMGRTDLSGTDSTVPLTHSQFHSAHRLASELPDTTEIYPTHGFGSFCAATPTRGTSSTIGQEKNNNPVFQFSEDDYVDHLISHFSAYPAYYVHMGPLNMAGPVAPDFSEPRQMDGAALRRAIAQHEWVVDIRDRFSFAKSHIPGSLWYGIEGPFITYLGWLIPWGTPLTLIGGSSRDVAHAQRELVRIGIDRPAGFAIADITEWEQSGKVHTHESRSFADLGQMPLSDLTILDVRLNEDWDQEHIDGARHIPLHQLPERVGELPSQPVWVHCASGYRAAVATSILLAHGHDAVAINDSFSNARTAGLSVVEDDAQSRSHK